MNLQHAGRLRPVTRVSEQAWTRLFKAEALAKQNGRCSYCHEPIRCSVATADHVKPRSKGGVTVQENIKAACEPCNKVKSNMSAAIFLAKIKSPRHGDNIWIWVAWSRRKIWLATERACKRIERFAT